MKNLFVLTLMVIGALPVRADILLSPEEEATIKQHMEQGQKNCPESSPLFDGEKCHSCDEDDIIRGRYTKCSEICPNRQETYLCGPACLLKGVAYNCSGPIKVVEGKVKNDTEITDE